MSTTASTPQPAIALIPFLPMIDDMQLVITRDPNPAVSLFDVDFTYLIRWPQFAQLTNLAYQERWELVGVDPLVSTTLYVGPLMVGGISPNGNATTTRTHTVKVDASLLDEDPSGLDEIAAKVTVTPLLPLPQTRQSDAVTVAAP